MNDIEDRLREELKEFAQRAQPEWFRPLRPPAPRRRTRTARWLAPVAAAVAVMAVVAGATLAGHTVAPQPASRPPARAGMPAYYVTVDQQSVRGPRFTETANVYDTVTGRLLHSVPVPYTANFAGNDWISAAANGREFVISSPDSALHLLSLAADGRPEGLRTLPVQDARPTYSFPALSPDGSHIAYMARVCENTDCEFGVGVMPVGQPHAAKFWLWPRLAPQNLSWAPDGTQVMFSMYIPKDATQYRLLNVTGPGGSLLADSREISIPVAMRGQLALLTPDGRDVVGTIVRSSNPVVNKNKVTVQFVEMSRSTGRLRLLFMTKAPARSFGQGTGVESLAGPGVQPLVLCNQGLGLIKGGRFIPRPGFSWSKTISAVSAAW
jgi:hypothetical protein